jgi:hypothetical protein
LPLVLRRTGILGTTFFIFGGKTSSTEQILDHDHTVPPIERNIEFTMKLASFILAAALCATGSAGVDAVRCCCSIFVIEEWG